MLVDLPEGWEKDPKNLYAKELARYKYKPQGSVGKGHYLDVPSWAIEFLRAAKHPLDPTFTGGSDEERMAAIVRHFKEDHPEEYGICDYPGQVLERWPCLETDERTFVILFIRHRRAIESESCWRWHKQGRYIGTQDPQGEYFRDDKHIDVVYGFEVVQIRTEDQ